MNRVAAIDLTAEECSRLNQILDGCFWNSGIVDEQTRIGVVAVEIIGVLFEGQRTGDAYPVMMACHPVSRVAASYKVDGLVRPLDLADIDSVVHEFSFKEIDDWDIIDPPADQRFRWQNDLSLDKRLNRSDGRAGTHFLEIWQDDGSSQSLDLALWFQNLFLFDANMNALTLSGLEAARRKRLEVAGEIGWSRTARLPAFDIDDLLGEIQSVNRVDRQ